MGKRLGIATCLMFVTGCSTTATVSRRSGPPIEGHIQGGSKNSIMIEADGHGVVVPRSDIEEIDHPGNVHTLIGGLLLGYGVFNIAVGVPECDNRPRDERTAYCIGVFTPAVLGAAIMIWGLVTNGGSKSAADDRLLHDPFPPPSPGTYAPGYAPPWYPASPPAARPAPPSAAPVPSQPASPPAAPSAQPVAPTPAEAQPPPAPAPTDLQ